MNEAHMQSAAMAAREGILFIVGYVEIEDEGEKEGWVVFEARADLGRTKLPFADGSTRKRIARADKGRPSVCTSGSSEILVALAHKGQMKTYLSEDMGETWSFLDALP